MKFEWDPDKEKTNRRKHRVSFIEACYVFADKYMLTLFDDEHSGEEERWISMGRLPNDKVLVVVHTYRKTKGVESVRIISARRATKHEEKKYFERRGRP